MATTRALIYLRQSKDSEDGIDRQLAQCTQLCERNGWAVAGTYPDNDETADAKTRRRGRPQYVRLLADVEAGAGDVIVFQTTDRLLRDVREMEDFIDLVERTGIAVASTQLGAIRLDTVDGRLNARLGAVIARAELERRRKRQIDQQRQAAERGESTGRRAFGYRYEGGQWVLDEEEALLVKDAFDRLLRRGQSLIEITSAMNESGYGNAGLPGSMPWTRRGVRWMLTSGRYAGIREYHKGREDEVISEGNWLKIITVEDHERALRLLNDRSRWSSVSTGVRKHIGTSLYLCGCPHCQGKQTVRSGASSTGLRVYKCPDNHLSRPIEPVDQLVIGVVEGYLGRPDGPAQLIATKDVPEVGELRAEIARLQAKIDRAVRDYDDEVIDGATLKSVKARRQGEIKVAERKIAAAIKTSQLAMLANAPDPVATFRGLGLSLRREIINALVTVTLLPAKRGRNAFDPSRVGIEWK